MRVGVILAITIGLAIATTVAGVVGFGLVFAAIERVGPRGLATLCAYTFLPFLLLGSAWWVLDAKGAPGGWPTFIWSRIVRDSAGELLPFSQVGGFVAGARAAIERGVPPATAFSTTVVDVTTELIAQLGFTGLGIGLLVIRLGMQASGDALLGAALGGLGLTAAGAFGFLMVQRRGGGRVRRMVARFVPAAAAQTGVVVRAIEDIYRHPLRVVGGVAIHLLAWVASGVGIWLALRVAGIGIDLWAVLAIESLVGAVRSAAFAAPMGIGVQEASYALLGPLFGLGAELSLAVSLLKRARDLVIGVPALLTWQGLEGARLVRGGVGRPEKAASSLGD
jgi:putative membrane protein